MPSPSGTGTAGLFIGTASPTLAFTMPATGARRAVVGFIGCFDAGGATVTGATYGGVSMGAPVATFGSMATGLVQVYVLANPATGANNFIVNASAALDEAVLAIGGFTDVNQTTPAAAATGGATGNGTTSGNLSATLSANDYLVGGAYSYNGAAHTITPGGTQISEREATGNESGVNLQYGTSSPINWTYSAAVNWFIAGVRLIHDAGVSGTTVNGETRTVSVGLVAGYAESSTQVYDDLFIIGDTTGVSFVGGYNLVGGFTSGATDATVNGQTLSVSIPILVGSVAAGSSVDGQTLSTSASLIIGAVSAGAVVTGQVVSVLASLITGVVSSASELNGQTLSVSVSLLAGTASAGSNADVLGQTLSINVSINAGTVTFGSAIGGQVLTVNASALAGSAAAESLVAGHIVQAAASLLAGSAFADTGASVNGQTLQVTVQLDAGSASGNVLTQLADWFIRPRRRIRT